MLKLKSELPKAINQKVHLRLIAPYLFQEIELRNLRKVAILAVEEGYQTVGKPINLVVIRKSKETEMKERTM